MSDLFPVVILAGGRATRLKPLTDALPKSLIKINNQPFINHQLRAIQKQGVHEVVLCVGFLGEMIAQHVGDGSRFGLHVRYIYDGTVPLGTAGAIKQALPLLNEHFFVLYGDSYLTCDFSSIQATFEKSNKQSLMTVFHNQNRWDRSNVEYIAGNILVYDKENYSDCMQYIDQGLNIFNKSAFDFVPENTFFDLSLLSQILLKNKQLAAYEVDTRFYEIGSFAGISALEHYLATHD